MDPTPLRAEELPHPDPYPGFVEPEDEPRKRGWPKGRPRGPRKPRVVDAESSSSTPAAPATAAERIAQGAITPTVLTPTPRVFDHQQVQHRLEQVIRGLSGVPAAVGGRAYIQATPEEAANMADPLADYLIKRAPQNKLIATFLEEYDLIVFILATCTYVVRVINDHRRYTAARRLEAAQLVRDAQLRRQHTAGGQPAESGVVDAGSEDAVRFDNDAILASHQDVRRSGDDTPVQDDAAELVARGGRARASAPIIPAF